MIPRIKSVKPLADYKLYVVFDDGKSVVYRRTDENKTGKRDFPAGTGKAERR